MSLLRSTADSLKKTRIEELKRAIESLKNNGVTWAEFFGYFRPRLDKSEWMILDSAMKGGVLDTLDKTLLLTPELYLEMLQNLTLTVSELVINKTIK